MANITFIEGSGLQDSIFGKNQAPIRMFLEKRGAVSYTHLDVYKRQMQTSAMRRGRTIP